MNSGNISNQNLVRITIEILSVAGEILKKELTVWNAANGKLNDHTRIPGNSQEIS